MKSLSFSGRILYYTIRYILIGLGIYIGENILSWIMSGISSYLPSDPKDLIWLILIPLSTFIISLAILFRFSHDQDHQIEMANGKILGRAGVRFAGYSLMVGGLLTLVSLSFVIATSWLELIIKY